MKKARVGAARRKLSRRRMRHSRLQSCSLVKASQHSDKRWLIRGEQTSTLMTQRKRGRYIVWNPNTRSISSLSMFRTRLTCLVANRSAVTPSSWKQSAATAVDARNLSMMFTARQQPLERQAEMLVHRDEPADELTARLCRQLQAHRIH